MRPKYLVSLFIGCLLIYVSIYGLAGFGLSLTGTNFREDFNAYPGGTYSWATGSGSGWTWSSPLISPAGQLEMNAVAGSSPSRGRCSTVTAGLPSWPSQYTIEFRLKVDQFGAGTAVGVLEIGIYDGDYWIPFDVYGDHVACGTQSFSTVTDNNWHAWTLVCDHTGSTFDVYREAVKLTTMQYVAASVSPKVSLDVFGGTSTYTLAHFDYIYVDAGLNPPSPQIATLTVNTDYLSGSNHIPLDGVPVTAGGSTKNTVSGTTSFPSLTPGSISVSVPSTFSSGGNTYTFSAWSDGGAASHSVTLPSTGLTLTATYTLDVAPPTTGNLKVTATYQGTTYVAVLVTLAGPQSASGTTTTDPNNPLTLTSLLAGSYTVSGTYSSIYASVPATVSAGTTNTATINFAPVPPTTGSLRVFAYYQGALVAVSVSVTGPQSASGTTTTDIGNPLKFDNLAPGTYTVQGTYGSSGTQTGSQAVVAGQTSDVTLTFQGTTPPDIITELINRIVNWVRVTQDNPTVREAELGIGGLMVLVSVIGFCWPGKKSIFVLPSMPGSG